MKFVWISVCVAHYFAPTWADVTFSNRIDSAKAPFLPEKLDGANSTPWYVMENGVKQTYYMGSANIDGNGTLQLKRQRLYIMGKPGIHSSPHREDFVEYNLIGKTINITVDLNGAGCGCNAAFYLVSMPYHSPGGCHDYYCDANSVCSQTCAEIDLMEMNIHALHVTMHRSGDRGGHGSKFGVLRNIERGHIHLFKM